VTAFSGASTLKYADANLIDHNAPVLATLDYRVPRPSFDLSGPGALHIVV